MRLAIDLDGADANALELLQWTLQWYAVEAHTESHTQAYGDRDHRNEPEDLAIQLTVFSNSVSQQAFEKALLIQLPDALHDRVKLVRTSCFVSTQDSARQALKDKTDSSLSCGIQALSQDKSSYGRADLFLTAGNTGALALFANRYLSRSHPETRPALCALLPGTSPTLMLDLGANLESTPAILEGYADMALALARQLSLASTSDHAIDGFGLLNIGTEGHKGTPSLQEAHRYFTARSDYHGFVEANQLFDNDVEVIVTDGFTGNIALKSAEGAARFILKSELLVDEQNLPSSTENTANTQQYNPALLNGAILLGYQQLAIKAHGASRCTDWQSALALAKNIAHATVTKAK